jgi:4'-phosphopantetheinyl transferase
LIVTLAQPLARRSASFRLDPYASLGDEVHVWFQANATADQRALDQAAAALPPEEQAHLHRLDAEARREYIAGRRLLRKAMAHYTGLPAAELPFSREALGKPCLDHGLWGHRLQFNLSHAGGLLACAVAAGDRDVRVGVDLERFDRSLDYEALARRYFSPQESALIARQPAVKQRSEFFAYWTLKEALLKARGGALDVPLSEVVFDLGFRAPLLLAPKQMSTALTFALRRREDFALAVAVEAPRGRTFSIRLRRPELLG